MFEEAKCGVGIYADPSPSYIPKLSASPTAL
jgi:hypothetical protein